MIAKKYLSENYDCTGYLSKYENGYYQEDAFLQLILPCAEAYINNDDNRLVIGRPGVDGIEFCYRMHNSGIWAFYPIGGEFVKKADTIDQLVQGWLDGSIVV